MSATVLLHCDAALAGDRCPEAIEIKAISAVAARQDAATRGWATRRAAGGHSTPIRDYCPACARKLTELVRNRRP